jgi:hypothetical protein
MTTTTRTMASTGELASYEQAIPAQPERGARPALITTAVYAGRQLAGALAIIALVWLVVMLFKHVQHVAFVLAGLGARG